jgi:hypothetical protein
MFMVDIQEGIIDLLRILRHGSLTYTAITLGCVNDASESIIHEPLFALKRCKSMDKRNIVRSKSINGVVASSCAN